MGFGRTAHGRSFVYHAGTAVEGVGGTCGSQGGQGELAAQLAYAM